MATRGVCETEMQVCKDKNPHHNQQPGHRAPSAVPQSPSSPAALLAICSVPLSHRKIKNPHVLRGRAHPFPFIN